jgi:2'-5' RNA ligase
MALLILAYPDLTDADRDRIEAIRARHDHAAGIVPAHFTLVYPLADLPAAELIAHAQSIAADTAPIPFATRIALPWPDATSHETQVFLVPDEGFSALARLHNHLYGGPLAPHLRHDLPSIPHITVARLADPRAAKAIADDLNALSFAIIGRIAKLDVIEHTPGRVQTLARLALGEDSL